MKKGVSIAVGLIILLGAIGAGAFAYMVSPTKGPSQAPMGQPPMGGNRPPMQPLTEASAATAESVTPANGQTVYTIIPEQSTATFTLDELLRGEPKTVVGTSTSYIAGEIGFDAKNPASSTVGVIKLNARTFVTDDKNRNNMIRRVILKTENDENEFITFKPTSITDASGSGFKDASHEFTFNITGDLTISGVAKQVTFLAGINLDPTDKTTLLISAGTTVKRSDFNLEIPNLSFLADVTDEVKLQLDLIAKPANR